MRALLSVSDKAGLLDFARGLAALNCELISTGGTAKALTAAGVPVTAVSDVTGFPEMMDGRVKTLHPKIHGGILARRKMPEDMTALAAQGIAPIDLVVVNLYPFEETAMKSDASFDELIENIDIGGPSMIRAAAKNFQDVLVVVDPDDYPRVLEELRSAAGPTTELRYALMQRAFAHTAHYDDVIAKTMANRDPATGQAPRDPERRQLRYGENPHQKAYALEPGFRGAPIWQVHQGKELSYTNLLDLDAAARLVKEFTEPAAVVIKHTNPCGVATAGTIADAYVRARDADSLSAFGGIVGLNRTIDEDTARALTTTFIEAVITPALDDGARPILAAKPNLRVATFDAACALDPAPVPTESRSFFAGVLVQEQDRVTEARDPWPRGDFPKVVTKRHPTPDEWLALRFAWRVCAHVKSNAVVFTAADRTLAIGAGQMSRVDAVRVAVIKAGSLRGSVAASDAFFPFRDGLDEVAAAGATAVVQPGGSVRDAEVIAAADEHGIAMVFTGIRHFRH
jgi:phosphoribosylaminoimidazolecarboxamide formyltransferase / IMP cyclohydrolase